MPRATPWRRRLHDDRGATMMVALLVAGICISLGVTAMVTSSIAQRDSGVDRQRSAAIAAAEAGVDTAVAAIRAQLKYNTENATAPCGTDPIVAESYPDLINVSVTIEYQVSGSFVCKPPSGSVVTAARITSVAEAASTLAGGSTKARRVMKADVKLTPPALPAGSQMIYAVHGEQGLKLTNGLKVVGADSKVYTNGDFSCNEYSNIEGDVYVKGAALIENRCKLGSVWANGTVQVKGGSNAPAPDGGPNYPQVMRELKSATGDVNFWNNPAKVFGRVTVKGRVLNKAAAMLPAGFDECGTTPPSTVAPCPTGPGAPPAAAMPAIPDTTSWDEPGKTPYQKPSWAQVVKASTTANGGNPNGDPCEIRGESYSVGTAGLKLPTTPSILDTRTSCSGNAFPALLFSGVKLILRSDTVIYAKSVKAEAANGKTFLVTTEPPDKKFKLRVVVPSPTTTPPQPTITCPPASSTPVKDMEFNSQDAQIGVPLADGSFNVQALFYTPNLVQINNTFSMNGSIYACAVNQNSTTTISYADVGPPQTGTLTGKPYTVDLRSKYEAKK